MRKSHCPVAVLLLTTLLGGCGPEELEEPVGEEVGELGSAKKALSYSSGGSWASPYPATPLAPTADRACFFTRVGGAFNSSGDSLRIAALRERWHVDGTGSTSAKAGCAALHGYSEYSTGYDWTAAQTRPTNLGSSRGRVCFLTRVGGSFNQATDWIGVYEHGGSWFLSGASQARNGSARARCVAVSSYSGEYSWEQGTRNGTYLGRTGNRVCALTYMAGQFDGASEFVEVSKAAGHWYLSGGSRRSGVAAKARCF
jgi:hypothetical protein